jgi:hypothetical protein
MFSPRYELITVHSMAFSCVSLFLHAVHQGGIFSTWQRRWCVLSQGVFRYFKGPSDGTPKGSIPLKDCVTICAVQPSDVKGRKFCFKLVMPKRDYVFQVS